MNDRLLELIAEDEFDLFDNARTRVIELAGPPEVRLAALERASGLH